jgi:hypothetical protein
MKLDWIKNLIDTYPDTPTGRKNFITIAGYPRWETVNSNLLAFYFDEKEEHGFSRLFVNSLCDIYEEKLGVESFRRELLETEFTVEREKPTSSGKKIDLLLKEEYDLAQLDEETISDWAIIIENKLDADLYNDLADYWQSVKANNKIGIVLSINPVEVPKHFEKKGVSFVNITHDEFVEKIMQNLPEFYIDSDDRHLLLLKEYISNIKSYNNNQNTEEMDKTLQLFQLNKKEIKEFKRVDKELLGYVSQLVIEIMDEMGFQTNAPNKIAKAKHFFINETNDGRFEKNIAKKFRFWVELDHLRDDATFKAYFELWGKDNINYGDKLMSRLSKLEIFTDNVKKGSGGKSADVRHIYNISIPIGDFTNKGFNDQLKDVLSQSFFDHKNRFIETAIDELKKIIESE